jgi:hypothetical protein
MISKRCFIQIYGYEPVGPDEQQRRFIREMARFQELWNVQGRASIPPNLSEDGLVAHWTIETKGPNWQVRTDFYCFCWDDIVAKDLTLSDWKRVPLGIATLLEFILSGTVFRYFSVAWRYGCFFLYPLLVVCGLILLSVFASKLAFRLAAIPHPAIWVFLAAFFAFVGLWRVLGRKLLVRIALDDWCFAGDVVHRRRPEFERRFVRFAQEIIRLAAKADFDEIVIHGHSLGAPFALAIIDRALSLCPELDNREKPIHIATTGSSLLKLALHPAAGWLRDMVGRLATSRVVDWVEFQAADDFLNVYNVDPVVALGIPATGKPLIKRMSIQAMLRPETYARFRFNFWRIHRQPRMGNERRYFYDYNMLCCGPLPFCGQFERSVDAVGAFAVDGALTERPIATAPSPAGASQLAS